MIYSASPQEPVAQDPTFVVSPKVQFVSANILRTQLFGTPQRLEMLYDEGGPLVYKGLYGITRCKHPGHISTHRLATIIEQLLVI